MGQAGEASKREAAALEHAADMEGEARAAWDELLGRDVAHCKALDAANAASQTAVADAERQHAVQMQSVRHDLSSTQASNRIYFLCSQAAAIQSKSSTS